MKRFALVSATFLLSGIVALALGEVVLRGFGFSSKLVYQPNPYFGWSLPKSASFSWVSEGGEQMIETNSYGLRGKEMSNRATPGTFRVLVLGDSFTEALQVSREDMYGHRLASKLADDGEPMPETEIVSAGVSGFGTDNALLYLRHEGEKFEPDLVVLGFYLGNDVRNNWHALDVLDSGGARKPHFELSGGELVLHDFPFADHTSAWSRLKVQLNRYLVTYSTLRESLDRIRHMSSVPGDGKVPSPPLDLGVFRTESNDDWRMAWSVTEGLLVTLDEEVRVAGGRLLVLLIPTRFQVHQEHWQGMRNKYGLDSEEWNLNEPNERIAEILTRRDISYIELLVAAFCFCVGSVASINVLS